MDDRPWKGSCLSLTEADTSANVFRNLIHVGSLESAVFMAGRLPEGRPAAVVSASVDV